jgi:hypothetical protein
VLRSGGGGCGAACEEDKNCNTKWDCKSGICSNSTCAPVPVPAPTCMDGLRNGEGLLQYVKVADILVHQHDGACSTP